MTFRLDDAREAFAEDARKFLGNLAAGLEAADLPELDMDRWRSACEAMRAGVHGLAGTSSILGLDHIARPARQLEVMLDLAAEAVSASSDARVSAIAVIEACRESLPAFTSIIEHELAGEHAAAIDRGHTLLDTVERVATATEREGQRRVAVTRLEGEEWELYLDEAAEVLDKLSEAIAALDEDTNTIPVLKQLLHTLKGATNTAGLGPVGAQIHVIESALERVHEPTTQQRRELASALARAILAIRRNIALAAISSEVVVEELPSTIRVLSATGATRGAEPSPEEVGVTQMRTLRVSSDRVDGLLDRAGELVAWKSRLLSRIARMQALGKQSSVRHGALKRAVDDMVLVNDQRHAEPAELGLDGDQQLLSRRLDEMAADIHELQRELTDELLHLEENAEELGRIVLGIQDELKQARMVPVGGLLARLRMPILDAATRSGKQVDVLVEGEGEMLDKDLSDGLYAPLLHVVRNAVVHGIEDPAARIAAGKPARGRIVLRARPQHELIVIDVSDDGAGIDTDRLRALGIAQGLVPPDITGDDPRLLGLVFAQGISTSTRADQLSGRGVGGEIVRTEIDRLRGSIAVSTRRGEGTTFSFSLPLAVSIVHVILARGDETLVAIPFTATHSTLRPEDVEIVEGERVVRVDGAAIRVRSLSELLGYPSTAPTTILVCALAERRIAIELDAIVGHEEVVVKPLGRLLDGHPLFAGCAALGDGDVALVIDVRGLFSDTIVTAYASPVIRSSTRRRRVLFVDDSISIRKVAQRLFAEMGVDVVTATDGVAALEQVRDGEFSLVFTDLEMPRMNGYDLLRELPNTTARRTPVVVMSSRSGRVYVDQALELGAIAYLTKPFTSATLADALARYAAS